MHHLTKKQLKVYEYILLFTKENGYPPSRAEICNKLNFKSINSAQGYVKILSEKGYIEVSPNKTRAIKLLKTEQTKEADIALIGKVAAGLPILAFEESEKMRLNEAIQFKSTADYLLRVVGASMIDFGIFDGDLVAIQKTNTIENGSLMVVRISEEATLKKVFKDKDHVRLKAGNKEFKELVYRFSDSDINVEGKVVGVIRNY